MTWNQLSSKSQIACLVISKEEENQQENRADNHPANGRRCAQITAIRVAHFAQSEHAIENHSQPDTKNGQANHHEINSMRLEPEDISSKNRIPVGHTRREILIAGNLCEILV